MRRDGLCVGNTYEIRVTKRDPFTTRTAHLWAIYEQHCGCRRSARNVQVPARYTWWSTQETAKSPYIFKGCVGRKVTGSAVSARWKGPGRQTGFPAGRFSRMSGRASSS